MNIKNSKNLNSTSSNAYQSIVEAVSRAINLPASIWVPDEKGKALRIRASVGLSKKYVNDACLDLNENSVTGEAYLTGKITNVYDIPTDPRWQYKDYAEEMGWKSALCVPIKVHDMVIGVISVYTFINHEFPENEKHLIENYAAQIELTESMRKLVVLGENLGHLITKEPKVVLDEIVGNACHFARADAAVLYPFDPFREEFYNIGNVSAYGLNLPLELKDKPRTKRGMAGYVLHRGEVVFENIREENPELYEASSFIQREGITAFMGMALVVSGKILGVLYVDYRTPHKFSEDEKDTIRLFSHQAAIALNNSRLFQQLNIRADALEKLHSVGSDLVSITVEPEELVSVLRKIVKNAQEVLSADLVDLYQYNQSADEFVLPPVRVGKRLDKLVPKIVRDDDYVYEIVREKKAIFTADSQAEPTLTLFRYEEQAKEVEKRFVYREQIKSTAALPLVVGQEVLGVIFINFRIPQTFPDQQRKLIELFANQAAIAINNTRLYQQTKVRAEALKSLHAVTSELVSITNAPDSLEKILNQIANNAHNVLNADLVDIYQYLQVEDKFLLPPAKAGIRYEPEVVKDRIFMDDVLYAIIGEKVPLYARDAQEETDLTRKFSTERVNLPRERFVVREKIRSSASIPMIVGTEVVGVLFVNYRSPQTFQSQQKELIELFASQAAIAIRNARQYREIKHNLEQRLNDIRSLRDITERMHRGEIHEVLGSIAERAVEMTGAKYGGVWLLDKAGTSLEFGGLAGEARFEKKPPNIPVAKGSERSINKYVVQKRLSHLSPDVLKDKNYKKWYEDTRSELTVPLTYGDRVVGTINVESDQLNWFTEDHRRLLKAMAGQVAMVVQMRGRLDALEEVGIELTSDIHKEKDEILELIFTQAQKLTDAKDMYIATYNENTGIIDFPLMTEGGERKEFSPRKADMEKRGMTEEIILTRKPILHKTQEDEKKWFQQPGHEERYNEKYSKSWLGVPMIIGNRVLGVIALWDWGQEYVFDEQDLSVLSSMASQAAIALDNANLYYDVNQKLERRVDALATLNEVGKTLTSGIRLKENEIVKLIFDQAQQLTGARDLYISLYDEETGTIRFALATEKGQPVSYPSRIANIEKRGKTEEIIFTRQPILHKTKKEGEEWYSQLDHGEFIGKISSSWLGVPMMVGEKILGVIAAVDEQEYTYDELHLEVLSSMASQAAMALENARLFEAAREEVVATKQLATLGTAIAALQHRINNTFNIIIPNVTRLRSRVNLKDPIIVEILDIIERNARYTSKIVSRIQEPLKEVAVVDVNVNAIIQDVVIRLENAWKTDTTKPYIAIRFNLDDTIPTIRAPSGQIAEVFSNLLDNAHKVMPKGGEIVVSSELKNGMIYTRVKDAGPGISSSIQKRLFEKPVPSRDPGGGAGLGLWLSRLMLQSIGGDIFIEASDSSGTKMCVTIPVFG